MSPNLLSLLLPDTIDNFLDIEKAFFSFPPNLYVCVRVRLVIAYNISINPITVVDIGWFSILYKHSSINLLLSIRGKCPIFHSSKQIFSWATLMSKFLLIVWNPLPIIIQVVHLLPLLKIYK